MASSPLVPLIEQVRGLASGTLASLTGFSKYVLVDAIRADFIAFAEGEGSSFRTWQPCWVAFWKSYRLQQSVLRSMVERLAKAEGYDCARVCNYLLAGAASVGDEALVEALIELRWEYIGADVQAIYDR